MTLGPLLLGFPEPADSHDHIKRLGVWSNFLLQCNPLPLSVISVSSWGRILGPAEKAVNLSSGPTLCTVLCVHLRAAEPLSGHSPFPMRGATAGALGGRTGFSRGSIPFTCLSLSSLMCSIHLVPAGFLLACKASAVVAVEMVESMMGVSSIALRSPTPPSSVRGSSSPLLE